jgi:hypothetical protein
MIDLTLLSKEELIEIVNSQAAYIKQLESQATPAEINKPTEAARPVIPAPVTIDGKRYRFAYPLFKLNGITYRADEAQYDEQLMRTILAKKGQTILR